MIKKKKIAILSNGLARGGTDTFVINLVNGLDKNLYDVTVILSVDKCEVTRANEIIQGGSKVLKTCSLNGVKNKIIHLISLYKILKYNKFDIFQTNIDLFNGPNMFVSWLAGIPIRICHSHNSMQEIESSQGKNFKIVIYQKVMRWLCKTFSNRYAGCSELAMNFLFGDDWDKLNKKYKAVIVNNGIDLSKFKKEINKENKLKTLGIENKKVILTVGRLSPQKNPMMLLDIFNEICKLREDCELVWVGVGDLLDSIKQQTKLYGLENRVHFVGTRTDVNELMKCCDLFLFPSLFEGFGIVVVEAQVSGANCLVANTLPKAVDCGKCYFMSLDEGAKQWATKAIDILDGKISGQIINEKIEEYSIEHMIIQMESLF